MSIKIRLARAGSKKRPFYRVIAADSRMPRDGRFIEKLGTYNPLLSKDNEDRVKLNLERIKDPIAKIMGISGYTFTWKKEAVSSLTYEGTGDDTVSDIGIVSQEIEALELPGLVMNRDTGIKAVRYPQLIPLLIEAIKELNTKLDTLKEDYQSHKH